MEIQLQYPERGYIKNVKRAVNAGNTIHITITKPKIITLVKTTLTDLQDDKESKSSCIGFFTRWFKLIPFLTGHFYAKAAEYNCSFSDSNGLKVIYVKNT